MSDAAWFLRWCAGVVLAVCLAFSAQRAFALPDWSAVPLLLACLPFTILGALNAHLR